MGLFSRRRKPATDTSGLGATLIALRLDEGDVAPAHSMVVVFNAGGHARRVAAGKLSLEQGEMAFCFDAGPYTVDLTPFASAPEWGLRLRFVIDAANPRVAQQRFDLYLFSETAGRLELADFAAAAGMALQAELAQGALDLPPCTSLEEWHAFRAGLNQLMYTRYGVTVDDCVPVDLGEQIDYATILQTRAQQAAQAEPVAMDIAASASSAASTLSGASVTGAAGSWPTATAGARGDDALSAATFAAADSTPAKFAASDDRSTAPARVSATRAAGNRIDAAGAGVTAAAGDRIDVSGAGVTAAVGDRIDAAVAGVTAAAGDRMAAARDGAAAGEGARIGTASGGARAEAGGGEAWAGAVGDRALAASQMGVAELDARALRRLFLELPALSSELRLLALPEGLPIFQQHQSLLLRLGMAALNVNTMPSLAWAAPDQPLGAADQALRNAQTMIAQAALDEAWSLLARLQLAGHGQWPQLLDDADRICANLETGLSLRRTTYVPRTEPSL